MSILEGSYTPNPGVYNTRPIGMLFKEDNLDLDVDHPIVAIYCLEVCYSPGDLFPPRCRLKPNHDEDCKSFVNGGWDLGKVAETEWTS